jgi:hypothetical protein
MLSWADWKRKENLAKFYTIVLEFAALGSQPHLVGGEQRVLK